MTLYFKLAEQYQTQSEPAYCGLGTLSMVLNSLEVDPERKWKGVWRWYSEELLSENACCLPAEEIKKNGINMEQFWCMAKCNGADVEMFRYGTPKAGGTADTEAALAQFRALVEHASRNANFHVVVSYSRKYLSQTGDGHFSPIGGYHKEKDLVLLMDVARFKYATYWVSLRDLFAAMAPLDASTGKSRGYFIMSKLSSETASVASMIQSVLSSASAQQTAAAPAVVPTPIDPSQGLHAGDNLGHITSSNQSRSDGGSMLYRIFLSTSLSWRHSIFQLVEHIQRILQQERPSSVEQIIQTIFRPGNLPQEMENALICYSNTLLFESTACPEHKLVLIDLLTEVRKLELYRVTKLAFENLRNESSEKHECSLDLGTSCSSHYSCETVTAFAQSAMSTKLATFLLLCLPMSDTFGSLSPQLFEQMRALRRIDESVSSNLRGEMSRLRYQLQQLCQECGSTHGSEDSCSSHPKHDCHSCNSHSHHNHGAV